MGRCLGCLCIGVKELRSEGYLAAFSAKLDGTYYHEGFVPPVWDKGEGLPVTVYEEPVGHSKEESRRLQRLLFTNYRLVNGEGESKNLLEKYQHAQYQLALKQHGITQSMSSKGNCLDNSMMENFFGLLKNEFYYANHFADEQTFLKGLAEYIN